MISLSITSNSAIGFVGIGEVSFTSTLSPNPPHVSVDSDNIEYLWYINDEYISETNSLDYTFYVPGIYKVSSVASWTEDSSVWLRSYAVHTNDDGDLIRLSLSSNSIILSTNDKVFLNTDDAISGYYFIKRVVNQNNYIVDVDPPLTGSWSDTTYPSGKYLEYAGTENGKRRVSLSSEIDFEVRGMGTEHITLTTLSSVNLVSTLNKFNIDFFVNSVSSIDVKLYPQNAISKPLSILKSPLEAPHWYFTDSDNNVVDTLTLTGTKIYFDSDGLSTTEYADDSGDLPVLNYYGGISGNYDFYYYDEIPSNINIYATIDTSTFNNLKEKNPYKLVKSYSNSNLYDSLSYQVSGIVPDTVYITKDGYNSIDTIQWIGQKIPFIGILGKNNVLTRNYPTITTTLTAVTLSSIDSISGGDLSFVLFDNDNKLGGYVKGYIIPLSASESTKIQVVTSSGIVGSSNTFKVLDPNDYDYRKINEDYDLGAKIRDYALPEKMQNYELLWEIISKIYGDGTYSPEDSVGKTIYERISNFVSNNGDIDRQHYEALISEYEKFGLVPEINVYDYPEGIRRLVEFLSINKKEIWGYRNNYRRTFDYINNESSVQDNLGSLIDTSTVTLSSGEYIVIHSKREDKYELQRLPNLYTSLSSSDSFVEIPTGLILSAYTFSTYETLNPHGLYKNSDGNFLSNYEFYTYNNTEGDIVDSVIDWDNSNTTLSESLSSNNLWLGEDGIVEKILNYNIKKGLEF